MNEKMPCVLMRYVFQSRLCSKYILSAYCVENEICPMEQMNNLNRIVVFFRINNIRFFRINLG